MVFELVWQLFFGGPCSGQQWAGLWALIDRNFGIANGNRRTDLVGGFKHDFYFPFHIWDVILPIDCHSIIFQDG